MTLASRLHNAHKPKNVTDALSLCNETVLPILLVAYLKTEFEVPKLHYCQKTKSPGYNTGLPTPTLPCVSLLSSSFCVSQ